MQRDRHVKQLDGMIAALGGADHGIETPSASGLLVEHLQAARSNVLSSRRAEYGLNLQQAKGALACVPDRGKRAEMKRSLLELISKVESAS